MAKSKSSHRWLQEHHSDPFVIQARKDGYRSRAVYKLIELQEKDHFLIVKYRCLKEGLSVQLVFPRSSTLFRTTTLFLFHITMEFGNNALRCPLHLIVIGKTPTGVRRVLICAKATPIIE